MMRLSCPGTYSLIKKDQTGKNKPIYGDVGTFVAYSTVPEDHWLHGFPHEKTK